MDSVELNYRELAFLMGVPTEETKLIFYNEMGFNEPKVSDTLSVSVLRKHFPTVISIDDRFHGANKLDFYLCQRKESYKNHLNNKVFIKAKKFTGGASVFYKICTVSQLEHAKKTFDYKYNYLFNKNRNDSKI